MAKNILAFFGLVFLTIIILGGVVALAGMYDTLGIVKIPQEVKDRVSGLLTPAPVELDVSDKGAPEWSNPLDSLPIVTVTAPPAQPLPTETPLPPLAPEVYRTETILQLKRLVAALDHWLEANDRLAKDSSLIHDPAWTGEIDAVLREIEQAGADLLKVGPPPQEYQAIAALLSPVGEEALLLAESYREAVESASPPGFTAAGQHFTRLKEYLSEAVKEMVKAGWSMEPG